MLAVGHTRPEHQSKRDRNQNPEDVDMVDDSDADEEGAGQEIQYDADLVEDGQDGEGQDERMDDDGDEDDVSIADEEADYGYVMDEVLEDTEDSNSEDDDKFDLFMD